MNSLRHSVSRLELREEIEQFLSSLRHPILMEDEIELLDLTAAEWRLTIQFGKLVFEAWNPARSIARRVDEISYRDAGRMGVFARRPGARETSTLEFRELEAAEDSRQAGRGPADRAQFRAEFVALLKSQFPGWRFERISNRSDREHSFSAWYTRGLARRGTGAWAFLGLGEGETPAAADAALAQGLIWLDWLRSHSERVTVSGLKLFLPHEAAALSAHRAAYLSSQAAQVGIFEWRPGEARPASIDLKDFGNVETRLTARRRREALVDRHRELLSELLGEDRSRIDVIPDASGSSLSLRVLGLEVARVEGELNPRVYFGLEGSFRRLEEDKRAQFRRFLKQVFEVRQPHSEDTSHEFYRLQSERWLESLLVRDLTRIDPALSPDCVYPQVPAFSGPSDSAKTRGVIDILSVLRRDLSGVSNRLAVIELKLQEEINLPLQGLDYWLRVKWLHERNQFQQFGYFPGVELATASPVLYLVSPAFRFHSTIGRILRYLSPSVEVIQVGLNDSWRAGLKVLFRRSARGSNFDHWQGETHG